MHDEIPATWRELTDRLRIVWLRVPAAPSWKSTVDTVLTRHRDDEAQPVLDVVASGPIAADVADLVRNHEGLVRSLLLVDPEVEVDEPWIRVVTRTEDTPAEDARMPAPLPLGHPDVVSGVLKALSDLDGTS
ncbi:hypothetical protein SAMN05216188_109123 [Lentzea xinjiangensis]|uniref:Uncharacterized protein n=1 Tax=Lentzea xinjiangensis TaxID=402600 RepID=A0A1H9MLZ3_9PSEU|nr:hypothetical protein SAMN05216188_109123 [Lentzea xinjiangensis]